MLKSPEQTSRVAMTASQTLVPGTFLPAAFNRGLVDAQLIREVRVGQRTEAGIGN
jgi:hypothetical protein